MMRFALRFGQREYPLGQGPFVIGRSEDCGLCLDDPMASRRHAQIIVNGDDVLVEDLQSRNGVYVNTERLTEPKSISHGDSVRIGGQEMVLIRRSTGRAETLAQRPVTARLQAFGILGNLADKALALGRGDEAERIVGRQLENFLTKTEKGEALGDEEFEKAVSYAFKIGALTRKGKWLDYLFRIHAAEGRLMDGELVNELYSVSSKMSGATRNQLRSYVDSLQDAAMTFAPGERFVLKRIEGLEALLG